MSRAAVALCALFAFLSSASAQVIYEPVQYQYRAGTTYYYGGSDPRVHERAAMPSSPAAGWGRVNGYAFVSGNVHTHREVMKEPTRVYTDALPYRNAAVFGFTPADARNEAYRNAPTYFRKSDLVAAGRVTSTGAIVVPSHARPIERGYIMIRRVDRDDVVRPLDRDELRRKGDPILIIPKRLLDRPLNPEPTAAHREESGPSET
jgi:hypothetical protein